METRVTPEQEVIKRAKEEIEKRCGKTTEQLYEEREKRLMDTIQLKVPDRMPVYLRLAEFPIRYAGLSPSAMFYDPAACQEAIIKTLLDFEPDILANVNNRSGLALEQLGPKQFLWPGGNLRPDQSAQFLDMEIMKEDEYDLFMIDPSDFIMRYFLPRSYKALEPLAKLYPFRFLGGELHVMLSKSTLFTPEIIQAFEALSKAGQEQAKFDRWLEKLGDIGIPPLTQSLTYRAVIANPPFDLFVSFLRGMRGTMIDMFKRPEELLAAMEKVLEWQLARATPADPKKRRTNAGGNHFQSEEFLSRKQFETFPWPTWKRAMLGAIDLGFIPRPFMEGKNDDRIELFLELPKGKAFIGLEKIDIVRAKEILGGHLCIDGGVPGSLLWGGSPQEVEEYCKNLIKVCGKGGGFILSCNSGTEDGKPANVKAMVDAVKKYGRYD